MKLILLSIFISLVSVTSLFADDVILIAPDFQKRMLNRDVYYFIDKDREYNYDSISTPSFGFHFIKQDEQIPYLSHLDGNVWIKCKVQNQSPLTRHLLIQFDFPLNDTIILYRQTGDILYTDTVGFAIPFSKRSIQNADPLFEIKLSPQENLVLYFKISNSGIECPLPVILWDELYYYQNHNPISFFHGIFYGMLCIIILINIFLYTNVKKKIYLFYIFYILFFTVFIMVRDGIAFKYLWPGCLWCAKQSAYHFANLSVIFMLLFTRSALKTDFYFSRTDKAIIVTIIVNILFSLLNLFLPTPIYFINNYLTLISELILLSVIVQIIKYKQMPLGKYFAISYIFLAVGVSIFVLKNLGFFNFSLGEKSLKLSFLAQLIVLTYGLLHMYQAIIKNANQSVVNNLRQLNRMKDDLNTKLEQQVDARTKEIDAKNEELIIANKQLGAERDIFEMQRNLIANQKQQTTDSILYAKRIQNTLMDSLEKVKVLFPESFLIDIPKDIVSGDFYWTCSKNGIKYAAVADGTGHGVPGAFMSIIGITYLNEIVHSTDNISPNEILNKLRNKIVNSLGRNENKDGIKDGLDIALISVQEERKRLCYAGAYNSLYIARNNELLTLKADRMPISSHDKEEIEFTLHEFDYRTGDIIYLFSDGYVDQFGWRTGKKYKHKQFKELLIDINEMPVDVKQVVIKNSLRNWMGDLEQVDDIMIMGIQL